VPDLLALKMGRAVFLEIKQPGKKPSELQAYRIDQLRKQGFEVIVATSKTDIEHL
jgi:predicted mannosyl-3-phosphoglycerate phosphatase (HAD superfamily)